MLEATLSTVDSAVAVPRLEGTAMIRFLPQVSTILWAVLIGTAWMIVMWATTGSIAPIVLWFIGLFVVIGLRVMSRFTEAIRHAPHS